MVLRRLIDSDLDVDKGDYVLRDAYHCGVSYGIYDPDLLWENIVITDTYDIGVKEKAAIEAWTLSLARYKMFQYVYKHHIRNITDALLIDIIISVLGQKKENFDQEILPVQDPEQVNNDKLLSNFVYWTDNTMLKALSEKGGLNAANKIAKFSKRDLYKRALAVALNKYPNASGNEDAVRRIARTKQQASEEKDIYWNFILFNDVSPPVLEKRVQDNIKIMTDDGRCTPLAHFLGFALDQFNWDAEDVEYPAPETKLHVFIEEGSSGHTRQVQSQLESALEHDLGMGLY